MTRPPEVTPDAGLLVRVKPRAGGTVCLTLDGRAVTALAGDTVLTAILLHQARVRTAEFDGGDRAGFCLMGACQDCWVRLADGRPMRACTTLVADGMALVTQNPTRDAHG